MKPRRHLLPTALAITAVSALLIPLGGCSSQTSQEQAQPAALSAPLPDASVFPADAATSTSATATGLFCSAPVVIVSGTDLPSQLRAASLTRALGAPSLLANTEDLAGELKRLETKYVLTVGEANVPESNLQVRPAPNTAKELSELTGLQLAGAPMPEVSSGAQAVKALVALAPDTVLESSTPPPTTSDRAESRGAVAFPKLSQPDPTNPDLAECSPADSTGTPAPTASPSPTATPDPSETRAESSHPVALVDADTASVTAVANLLARGSQVVWASDSTNYANSASLPISSDDTKALKSAGSVLALGEAFGTSADLRWRTQVLRAGVELPGGGYDLFSGKRYVALYGTPVTPALGVLGEQDMEATVKRAADQAAVYQALTEDTVVPALEIIVTVASGDPGKDGNYSNEWPAEDFVPLVEAAAAAGQYVIIDFQPGRADFLTQVKQYEKLLTYPHVGIALDPEWRLGPDEKPLTRIGSVEAAEVNQVMDYMAQFVTERQLPPKMVILHQFQIQMLRDRDQIHTHYPQTPVLIHADGQGSQHDKQATWKVLHEDAPANVHWGWKNFIDEDQPMLTPEQTYSQVDPLPDLVTYQ